MHITIPIPQYRAELLFIYDTADNARKIAIKKYSKEFQNTTKEEIKTDIHNSIDGSFGGVTNNFSARNYLVWINSEDSINSKELNNSVQHELFHFTHRMFSERDTELSIETQECFAYFAGWISSEIHEALSDAYKAFSETQR